MQSLVSDNFYYYPQVFTLNLNPYIFHLFPCETRQPGSRCLVLTKSLDQCGIHVPQRTCLSRQQHEAAFWTPKDRLRLSPLDNEVSDCTWGWRQCAQVCELEVRCLLCEVQLSRKPRTASCSSKSFHWFHVIDHMVVLWLSSFYQGAVLDTVIS